MFEESKFTLCALLTAAALVVSCSLEEPNAKAPKTSQNTCAVGQALCGDVCVTTLNNTSNCGACGVTCATGQTCAGDSCQCLPGLKACTAGCIDATSDPQNCGACGTACANGQVCSGGACKATCDAGLTQCGASCVDTRSSVASCGGCDKACPSGQSCLDSACACPGGQSLCQGACTNSMTDPANCGECGKQCAAGATCAGGACMGGNGGAGGMSGNAGSSGSSNAGNGGSGGKGGTSAGSGGAAGGSGGTSAGTGGMSGSGGGGGSGGSGTGVCDPGTTTTTWASSCPTTAPTCTAGTWTAGGPDPDHAAFTFIKESAHFAIYSDESISDATAQSALDTLENTVWKAYFGSPIFFKEPLCNSATKTKASIHVHSDWGLSGGAWSSTRMGMWIGPGALADHWGLAHEFMHSVQSVSGGMVCNGSNTCGWIFESHANFMPHQLPEYRGDVHCSEMLVNAPHLYLGSTRDRYCNWQFMEYLKDKYCYSAVNDIWTSAASNDPFSQIMKTRGWTISQLNDFFGEWATHNVTWDYQNPPPTAGGNQGATYRAKYASIMDKSKPERRVRETMLEPLDASWATNRRFATPSAWAPQRWGYNVVRLYPDSGATSVTVTFRGVTQNGADSDWRWGLVATDSGITTPRYSALQKGSDGSLQFCVKSGEALFLVVTATPSVQKQIVWDQAYNTVYRYPWMVSLSGAWPDGFKTGALDACASGSRHSNGNGCVSGTVPATVFVGPYAQVVGGTVSGTARIEDHAVVLAGTTVSGGTVSGLSVLMNSFSVAGTAKAASTFYPLGFFEGGQGLSGLAQVTGDVEYRGQGLNKSTGSYFGFVDSTTAAAGSTTDVSPATPYTWRP